MDEPARKVRYQVFQFFLDKCRPPTIVELAELSGFSDEAVMKSLGDLQRLRHLTLYNKDVFSPTPISMVHPFSHLPTPYVVTQGAKSWYANCAWCGFGLAAMVSPFSEATVNALSHRGERIVAKATDERLNMTVDVGTDEKSVRECFAVFSPPPSKWWNDVRFACGSFQLCTSRQEAEKWHESRGFHKGDVLDLETMWELSKAWYGNKTSYEYEKLSTDEVVALFKQLGLNSEYWAA